MERITAKDAALAQAAAPKPIVVSVELWRQQDVALMWPGLLRCRDIQARKAIIVVVGVLSIRLCHVATARGR